jgi:hypothetical protein
MRKVVVLLVLLVAFLAWGAWAIAGYDGKGCTYGSEECGDPAWQNYPPH